MQVLVATDLTSAAYPAADSEDASRVLLEHLGVKRADSALARMRVRSSRSSTLQPIS